MASWQRLNIRHNHWTVPWKVSDGPEVKNQTLTITRLCVHVFVGTLKRKHVFAKLCAAPSSQTQDASLCVYFSKQKAHKKGPAAQARTGQPLDPEQIWNSLIKCLLFFPLSFMVHPSSSACQRSVSFSLSPHSNPDHEALNIQMLQCQWSELWYSGSTTYAHSGAPTEKQVQVRVMSWSYYLCIFFCYPDN